MIDHERIRTGFDFELQIGAEFFRQAVHAYFDAGAIPSTISGVTVSPPDAVRFHFSDPAVPASDRWDLEVDVPTGLGQTATLFLAVDLVPRQDPGTCLVTRVDFDLRYVRISQNIVDLLVAVGRDPAQVDADLAATIDRRIPPLLPTAYQRVHVRKLRGDDDFQDCYVVLGNLDLDLDAPAGTEPHEVRNEDPALAVPFLPHDLHVALGAPNEVYGRLRQDVWNSFLNDERTARPVMDGDKRIGKYTGLSIRPGSGDKIVIVTEVEIEDTVDVDVEQVTTIRFDIDDEGDIDLDVDVGKPEAQTEWWQVLIFVVFAFAFALFPGGIVALAGIPIGLAAGAMLGGIVSAIPLLYVRRLQEELERDAHERVKEQTESRGNGMQILLAAIPSRVSMVIHRDDPFFHHHHQVRTRFSEARVRSSGISFAGTVSIDTEDRAIENIQFVSRVRDDEPNGELLRLEYRVPNHTAIRNLDDHERRAPDRHPDVFALSRSDVVARTRVDQLAKLVLQPVGIRPSGSRIAEFLFDQGGALTPAETGNLHLQAALWVRGARLVRPRDRPPYYRTDPDRRTSNNLRSLPEFRSFRATQLVAIYAAQLDEIQRLATTTESDLWFWTFEDSQEQEIPPLAYHLIAGLVVLVDWLEAIGRGQPPAITFDDRNNAMLDPDDPVDEFSNFDAENLIPAIEDELVKRMRSLTDRQLDRRSGGLLFGPDMDNAEWALNHLDAFGGRVDWLRNRIDRARAEKRAADIAAGIIEETPPSDPPEVTPCAPPPPMP